ncbi:PLP-dependent aminotransferase family protein [Aminiphilus sp.]|uniref:aminotransferase-like domain-containing protein n=1 Tax=Aminiphilus sp. TaxID=1872488 RepID=UPI00260EEAF9|nr:PLP-dependent aminotransferase family protein [Aminiphilus sp.]
MSAQMWESLYSEVGRTLKPSPIRELLKLTKKPGMISFAGGMPDPDIFPVAEFEEASGILASKGKEVLQYGATEGYEPLKAFLAEWMAPRMGRVTASEEMCITTGSQQVMDLFAAVMLDPGDIVIVEAPTYPGALHSLKNRGARFVSVPCDAEGMQVGLLPGIIESLRKEGKKVKFIYSIVNFQNPSGYTLSTARRRTLLETARQYSLPIFEDDPYGHLRFDGEHEPTIFSMDKEDIVLYACSFSKILAPGTRVAWVVGPKDIIRKMVMVKQGSDLCTSVVAQALVYEYCRLGHLDGFLPKIISHYRHKRDGMAKAFRECLPEKTEYAIPQGGFFFWLRLPGIDTKELFYKAVDRGVAFVIGESFFPGGGGNEFARTCFTFASETECEEGAKRLALAIGDLGK